MYALPPAAPVSRQPAVCQPASSTASSTTSTQVLAPTIVQTVTVTPIPSRTDLLTEESAWTWEELRDYVCGQIIDKFGPFPRDSRKEYGIFSRFLKEFGPDAIPIAKFAFEVQEGWWANAPISVTRFCRASDSYFAEPIRARLAEVSS